MNRRVVVVGLGVVSPLGNTVQQFWRNIKAGESGVGKLTRFDPAGTKINSFVAAEVKDSITLPDAAEEFPHMDLCDDYALAASYDALQDSQLISMSPIIDEEIANRTGVIIGCGIGGVGVWSKSFETLQKRGKTSPYFIPALIPNMPAGLVGICFEARGPNECISSACASSTHSIGAAYQAIRHGEADVMIAGGTEAPITPIGVSGFCSMGALSSGYNESPSQASRPFDIGRDGFVVGEGAATLILEELEHAKKREAPIYAEIVGFARNSDAFHIAEPEPNGNGAATCMKKALVSAYLDPEQISYINAHGTSTHKGDIAECLAIENVFGRQAPSISATKSMTGHPLGAAGAIEALICTLAIKNQIIPPTINLESIDPECELGFLDFVPQNSREAIVNNVMSNSFGFGGQNGCLIFSRFVE